jgi:glycosyltransferase involved in cell wall biosynthesis
VGGIPEILTDGVEGSFWDTTDVQAAAERLVSILDDEPLRSRLGRAALATYNARFRSDRIADQLYRFVTDRPELCAPTVPEYSLG